MSENEAANAKEEPKTEARESGQITAQQGPVIAAQQGTDRLQRLLRRMSIWLAIVVVVFFAGGVTDHYLRYKPLSDSFVEIRTTLDQANQDIGHLQGEVNSLEASLKAANSRVEALENENKMLQDELASAKTHLNLLQMRTDINNARLALFEEHIEGAKTALADAPQRLDELLPRIDAISPNLAESLPQRLNLILSGLERDNLENVKIDLELFMKDLLEIEAALFGE